MISITRLVTRETFRRKYRRENGPGRDIAVLLLGDRNLFMNTITKCHTNTRLVQPGISFCDGLNETGM